MEIIKFYLLNIIVGALLAIVLGLYGSHLVARQKSMEIVFIGQSIHVGILIGVIFTSLLFSMHDDHGFHLEIFTSIFFSAFMYFLYEKISQNIKYAKTSLLILGYALLISFSYLVVSLSPVVETHMMKAFLGDIVTASRDELIFILIFTLFALAIYVINHKRFLIQSFELSLFNHFSSPAYKLSNAFFNIIVFGLMIFSIHVLGIVFTLCMMVLPITIIQFRMISLKGLFVFIYLFSPISVLIGFALNVFFENLPTSSLISLSYFALGCLFLFFMKRDFLKKIVTN